MTTQDRHHESADRMDVLTERRTALEEDLLHLEELRDAELTKWRERRADVDILRDRARAVEPDEKDEARMEWYAAEYQDAQQSGGVIQHLIERSNVVAQALTECQQELMQLPRDHRRG